MSLRDAWNDGLEWAGETLDDVKEYATEKVIDYKVDKYVKSFTDEFKGPTTITPEMAAEGWKPGLDGVPYNSKLNEKFEPGGIFYDPDVNKNTAIANAVASGAVSSAEAGATSSAPFELSQDLKQRTPSGTIYNPSMDDYNNASLFEYTGPGGLENYTYGEGLPTDYGIYGTPPGPNLYYEGQYGEGFVEPGVADPAIELPAVTMPDGVPQIPSSNASNKASNKKKDLTYAETIAAMGIAPGDAPSTLFPSPGNATNNESPYQSGMNPNLLNSFINEAQGGGLPGYTNNGTTSAADQAIFDAAKMSQMPDSGPSIYDTQYTVGANNAMSPVGPSIYDTQYTAGANNAMSPIGPSQYETMTSPTMIGGEEQVFDSKYTMLPTDDGAYDYSGMNRNIADDEQVFEGSYNMNPNDDGSFNYGGSISNRGNFETANNIYNSTSNNIIRNPNQETQPYRGIYVDPRTVPEIDLVESNVTYPPSFPAGYGDGNNMSLVTTTDEPYDDRLIMSAPMTVEEQAMGTNPELFEEDEEIVISTPSGDLTQSDLNAMLQNGITMDFNTNSSNEQPIIAEQYGLDEAVIDGYKYITNLFSDDEPSAEEVAASVAKEPSIWNSVMEVIAGSAGMGFPGDNGLYSPENSIYNNDSGMTMLPSFINEPTGNTEGQDMYDGFVQGASELATEFPTADPSITYSESPLFNTEIQNALINQQSAPPSPPVYIPSPVNPPSIFTKPPAPSPVYAAPGGAPNRPSRVPSYTWKPDYANGRF